MAEFCIAITLNMIYWQKLDYPIKTGTECIIYNRSYQPVFVGRAAKCPIKECK